MNNFDPRIAAVPEEVVEAIRKELGQSSVGFSRPSDGTTGRTFIVASDAGRHILRMEPNPAVHLPRAVTAITLAANASVAVPSIRAVCVDSAESHFWYLEDFVLGTAFPHLNYDKKEIQSATRDLGLNLRRLHSVSLKQFGLLAPNPWINWNTGAERYQSAKEKVERALKFTGIDNSVLPQIYSAYDYMIAVPPLGACLCKGDCRSTNILTHRGKISAIIDWEWASGDFGASDIAAWHFSNEDPSALDLILSGYQPDDADEFRRRVAALLVIGVITEFLVYEEHANFFTKEDMTAGLNERRRKLLAYLKSSEWLK